MPGAMPGGGRGRACVGGSAVPSCCDPSPPLPLSGDTRPQPREQGHSRAIRQPAGQRPSAQGPLGAGDTGWGHGLATAIPTWPALAWHEDWVAGAVGSWGWEIQPYPQSHSPTACSAQIHVFCFLSLFGCVFNSLPGLQGNSFLLLGFLHSCFISNQLQKPQEMPKDLKA